MANLRVWMLGTGRMGGQEELAERVGACTWRRAAEAQPWL